MKLFTAWNSEITTLASCALISNIRPAPPDHSAAALAMKAVSPCGAKPRKSGSITGRSTGPVFFTSPDRARITESVAAWSR
jgi:hypothetical protein